MLELRAVTVGFGGRKVFENLDLTLPEAGLYLFLGPNSSGKTVLLNLIGGRLAPKDGQVLLDNVPVYGLTGPELPRIEHLSREAVAEDGRSLHHIFLEHLRAGGGNETVEQALAPYETPWSEAEMKRLKSVMLPHGEKLEFELLCAFARKPDWLLVDDYFSRLSFGAAARAMGNLLTWHQRTGGTALLTSTRFFGFMEELKGVYLLQDGKLANLTPNEHRERERGDVLIVCGEYFYRHSRAQEDNPHLIMKSVLENALVIEVKSSLDEAVKYLGELGIDVQAIVLAPEMDSGFAGRGAFF